MTEVEEVARAIWPHYTRCDLRAVSKGPCSLEDECTCWQIVKRSAEAAIAVVRADKRNAFPK